MRISNTTKALWAIALAGILFSPEGFKYTAYFATKATHSAVQMFTGEHDVTVKQPNKDEPRLEVDPYSYLGTKRKITDLDKEITRLEGESPKGLILGMERDYAIYELRMERKDEEMRLARYSKLPVVVMAQSENGSAKASVPAALPPVKLNTESIAPLSREKLRFHEDIVRSLLN